jgi:hypothetical protein
MLDPEAQVALVEPFSQSVSLSLDLFARHDPELVRIVLLSVR